MSKIYSVEELERLLECASLLKAEMQLISETGARVESLKNHIFKNDNFTEDCAVNRDVAAERVLLEGGMKIETITLNSSDSEFLESFHCKTVSKRGNDWSCFADEVFTHIEEYTVPQYGDKGEDQASEWDSKQLVEQAKKYLNRFGKNQRPGQEMLDFNKAAHYCQLAATKYQEEQNATR